MISETTLIEKDEIDILISLPKYIKSIFSKTKLVFDYEVNNIDYSLLIKNQIVFNNKELDILKSETSDTLLDLSQLTDKKPFNIDLKQVVSKKKRRLDDKDFNLDMVHITNKIIAMGFPSKGCESIYRNSISEVLKIFQIKYSNNIKIYNLCIEESRIYNKDLFLNSNVALFPSKDHNPCSVRMILEFCVDAFLYFNKNVDSYIAVHCKAGKGRTGVMICSYLIFSCLVENSNESFAYYDKSRTYDGKGLTIPSQKRYVKYFETFLNINYKKPYFKYLIEILTDNSIYQTKNMLLNLMKDEKYFQYPDVFVLHSIVLGPFINKKKLKFSISSFTSEEIKSRYVVEWFCNEHNNHYMKILFIDREYISTDVLIKFEKDCNFYMWINLWFSTIQYLQSKNQLMYASGLEQENDIVKLLNQKKMFSNYKKVNYMGKEYYLPIDYMFDLKLSTYDLDKFKQKHEMLKEFCVNINYKIPLVQEYSHKK